MKGSRRGIGDDMNGTSVWRVVPATLLVGFTLALAPTAHAEGEVECVKAGSTLTITIAAGEPQVELAKSPDGAVIIWLGNYAPTCADAQGRPFDQDQLGAIDLYQQGDSASTTWLLEDTIWRPVVTMHNDADDELIVRGHAGPDLWSVLEDGASPSLSLAGSPDDPELALDTVPARTLLEPAAGDDEIRLTTGNAAWTGPAFVDGGPDDDWVEGGGGSDGIHPGSGADLVDAGAGDDAVYVDGDGEPDTVRPGTGTDALHLSTPDPSVGAVVDPATPGGDGVARNDDYAHFDMVWGTAGPDRFTAPDTGMTAAGMYGDDTYVSGPASDTFYGGDPAEPAREMGFDTIDYAGSDSPVTVTAVSDFIDQAKGHGADHLTHMGGIVGSSHDDDLRSATAFRIQPGNGDDVVRFGLDGGTFIADAGMDGSDMVLGSRVVQWDYSSRSRPLDLTADGVANDGLPGEQDRISGSRVGILGGSGGDLIEGDSSRNSLVGRGGDDRIDSAAGDDSVWGSRGDDVVIGGAGSDHLDGQNGRDVFFARDSTHDEVIGGAGTDLARRDAIDRIRSIEGRI